jgi:hypothetical protein
VANFETTGPVTLTLNPDEAFVLIAWLYTFDETDAAPPLNSAERLVLWRLEALLDPQVCEVFAPDYRARLDNARKRIVAAHIDLDYDAGKGDA